MNICGRLGLGTVQWGQTYGIANAAGHRPDAAEIGVMLDRAKAAGVTLIDTAQVYGEAEEVVGRRIGGCSGWDIVTKIAPSSTQPEAVKDLLSHSLVRLGTKTVYGLLLHRQEDLLLEQGPALWSALQALKSQGFVSKVGVSVYDPEQLALILDRYDIDLVQIPFNLYDQRFLHSGLLERVRKGGVEIHARSAFLQGLLLMPPHEMPRQFSAWKAHQVRLYQAFEQAGLTPVAATLRFCLKQALIDKVIIGCETLSQLEGILVAASADCGDLPDAASYAINSGSVIDPRSWTKH